MRHLHSVDWVEVHSVEEGVYYEDICFVQILRWDGVLTTLPQSPDLSHNHLTFHFYTECDHVTVDQ